MTCKFSFEVPLQSLELQKEFSDYLFVIAPWLESSEDYRNFVFRNRSQFPLYLDNGAYEQGTPMKIERYMDWIGLLMPDVIVAPDVYGDCWGTIELVDQFFAYDFPSDFRIMVVPQGRRLSEWTQCFSTLLSRYRDRFHLVGIPRRMYPHRALLAKYVSSTSSKPIHILGCPNPGELPAIFNSNALVESVDTSYPTRAALGKTGVNDRIDFFNDKVDFKSMRKAVEEFFRLIWPE